ncbi:MAG: YdcF family protein [bacterium]|nr:YdcF family protein [bacterium]
MFFYLSKIFAGFLFPYPLFFVLCAVAAYRLPRSRFRLVFRTGLFALYLLSINPVSGLLIGALEEQYPARSVTDLQPGSADAIVVLAGMVDPLSSPPGSDRPELLGSADRIFAGEELWRVNAAPELMISGGSGLLLQTGGSEALILQEWLTRRGTPISVEAASRNTAENAIETAKLAREKGWRRIILVSSGFHLPRSVACFRKAAPELELIPFPVDFYRSRIFPGPEGLFPAPSGLSVSSMAIKEYIGLIAYWLRGYI